MVLQVLFFTTVPVGPLGWVTAWPAGAPTPTASILNAYTGAVTANAGIIPAGTNGGISVYGSDAAHLIVDVNGYFAPLIRR